MKLHFTILNSVKATSKQNFCSDFQQFVETLRAQPRTHEKIKSRMIFAGEIGNDRNESGSYRTEGNVKCVSFAAIDHDHGSTTLGQAVHNLQANNVMAFGHTTHSYTPERPKWRIYAPLPSAILPGDNKSLECALKCVLAACGLQGEEFWHTFSESKKTLSSHSMFTMPPNALEMVSDDALPIDVDEWLPYIPVDPEPVKPAATSTSSIDNGEVICEGGRNVTLTSKLGELINTNPNITRVDLLALGIGINEIFMKPPLPRKEVENIVKSASKWIHPINNPGADFSEKKQGFAAYSIRGKSSAMKEKMLSDTFVLPEIAILGQATAIFAQANTGKTLLTLHLLIESIKGGNIEGDNVFYVNADDNYKGMIQKTELAEEHGFHILVPGHNGFEHKDLVRLLKEAVETDTASGKVVILDTLKKFTELMDKSVSSGFMKVVRLFVANGGTVIMLAHTNKHRDADGKAVYGGTSDIVDDSDCVYILDRVGEDKELVVFENRKQRGDTAEEVHFRFTKNNSNYFDLLDSVHKVEKDSIKKPLTISEINERIIIAEIRTAITGSPKNKSSIIQLVMQQTGQSRRKITELLDINVDLYWKVEPGGKNEKLYHIIDSWFTEDL